MTLQVPNLYIIKYFLIKGLYFSVDFVKKKYSLKYLGLLNDKFMRSKQKVFFMINL